MADELATGSSADDGHQPAANGQRTVEVVLHVTARGSVKDLATRLSGVAGAKDANATIG